MRLKSLDIKGFKSFADKTQVVLDNAITGIVGPNGCGKSNIVDAIRWVIGEHKIKSLRSDNLEDLVFNGSKSRAASGMAEVSLTFENTKNLLPTEFTTVTITRKFYKNGESEYRLNDVVCRLKDIHNLFLDTGVSNDSYAIIELGMVDDIIKDKDGSRRRMLEQAAGISMYKTRKKEAKLKLEGTQQDISRIEDLLFEIANNLRTLESQARKAEKYYQIKADYKAISIELAKVSLEDFNERYQTLQSEFQQEEDKKLKIETEISGDEAVIEKNKADLIQLEQGLNAAQRAFNELQNRIRGLENEKKLAAQRLEHLHDREKSIQNFLNNATTQELNLKENIEHAQAHIGALKSSLEDTKEKLEIVKDRLDEQREQVDAQRKTLDSERQKLNDLQRQQFDAEKTVAIADTSIANILRRKQQINDDKQRRNVLLEQLESDLQQKKSESKKLENEIQNLEAEINTKQSHLLQNQEQLEKIRERLIADNRILDSKKNEHALIQSLVQSWEGYPESIQYLSQHKDWNKKLVLLSDILAVNDEYKKPLEYVLDAYLNYYVVEDIEAAKEAIHLLSSNDKGKANFFILDQIKSTHKNVDVQNNDWIPALSVVNFDEKYNQLASLLLQNVFIANTNSLPTILEDDIQVVNMEGSILLRQNSVSGGSVGIFEGNKIGRAKNLELLSQEIETLSQKTAAYQGEINLLNGIILGLDKELNDKTIHQKRNELNNVNNNIINLEHKIENLIHHNEQDDEKLEEIQEQMSSVEDEMGDKRALLDTFNHNIKEQQSLLNNAQSSFSEVEQEYQVIQQQYNAYNLDMTKAQSNLDAQSQQIVFRENQLSELIQQITNNKTPLTDTQNQISETSGKLHFGDNELYEMMEKREKDEKMLGEKENEFYGFRNQIGEHEKLISRQRKEKDQAEAQIISIREQLNEMKLKVAGMKERLAVEFKVDLDDVLEEDRTTDMTVEEINAEAERLKKRLDNMGEINPTAIEAFQEVKVRHDFIVDQKSDLEQARDSLLATIEEVELTANAKFKETFDKVRENFIQVFKALFTEDDNADLRLTDESNLADTGIEIYAQPKGKRPSTLTQLSGGEKTLTSTAFLFAIYLIKPAPFCILDEVDAPLDDANVGKFTNMIRKFSDNSQFIIVTHNKQTMAAVDVIYGVTMQEAGVSKLVPVDFRSLN